MNRPSWITCKLSCQKPLSSALRSCAVKKTTHPLASKESALRQLTGLLKIEPAATMAIGDEQNDLGMIKAAGIGVAMGNAVSQLRAIADQVTADNNHNGVGEAILKWR